MAYLDTMLHPTVIMCESCWRCTRTRLLLFLGTSCFLLAKRNNRAGVGLRGFILNHDTEKGTKSGAR